MFERPGERKKEDSAEPSERFVSPAEQSPEDTLLRLEVGEELRRCISALPFKEREAFVLNQVEEISETEAATIACCTVGALRARVARAKAKLQQNPLLIRIWGRGGHGDGRSEQQPAAKSNGLRHTTPDCNVSDKDPSEMAPATSARSVHTKRPKL